MRLRTMMMVIGGALLALQFLAGCTVYEAPAAVQASAQHQLEDLAAIEAELLPFVPADAQIEYTLITGEQQVTGTGEGQLSAPKLWKGRLRAMMFRGAGLLAWSRGEPYDEQAAFAKLFPEEAAAAAGTSP